MSVFDNPYDPAAPTLTPETMPLDEVIRLGVEAALLNLHTWLPAQVTAVGGTGKVTLQPLLQREYYNGNVVNLPPIQNVMVVMPRGADYSIKLPVAVGDTGIALFCERSLDNWSVQGGIVNPDDARHHDLTDAIFIPGLYPFNNQIQDATTDLVLTNGKAVVRLQKAGTFKVTNGTNELIDLLDQLLDTLINDTYTLTILGPQPFLASTQALLTEIRQKLDTLKGS